MLRIITELGITNVADRGIPNKERIYLQAMTDLNLETYLLSFGYPAGNQKVFPSSDQYYWLGNNTVSSNTWIVVYTGPGQTIITKMQDKSNNPVLVLHWGKPHTILGDSGLHPFIVCFDGIQVAEIPELKRLSATMLPSPLSQI